MDEVAYAVPIVTSNKRTSQIDITKKHLSFEVYGLTAYWYSIMITRKLNGKISA